MSEFLSQTVAECGGCEEPLDVFQPYLAVQIKAQREVLMTPAQPMTEDAENAAAASVFLGTRSGRGRIVKFHNFECLWRYAKDRKSLTAKIEYHAEEGDPYVPEDNRTPEELVEAGELPSEVLTAQAAWANFTPGLITDERGEG